MSVVQLQTGTPPPPTASAPDPLAGVTLLNPDGMSPEAAAKGVRLTPKALKRIRAAMAKENVSPEQGGLRLGIQGGGCSGLSYNIRFDTKPRERDRTFTFDDTTNAPIRVFVDPKSFIYLTGMVLDFEETLMRQGFNFINPNSTKSCGCGSSFSS
jgi:iron-sulfur cluster assembly protein